MKDRPEILFAPLGADPESMCIVLAGDNLTFGARAKELNSRSGGAIVKAADAAQFKGKKKSTAELLAPPRIGVSRLLILGTGKAADLEEKDWVTLGGVAAGAIKTRKAKNASLIADVSSTSGMKAETIAALLAFGAALRLYEFSKYQTKKGNLLRGKVTNLLILPL